MTEDEVRYREAEEKLATCAFHRGEIREHPPDYPIRWCRKCQREQDAKAANGLPLDRPSVPLGARPPVPTCGEMVSICMDRRDEAERDLRKARGAVLAADPGSQGRTDALAAQSSGEADLAHWARLASYWRVRAQGGRDNVPTIMGPGGVLVGAQFARPPQRDQRLPREPGDDDGDEEAR